MKKILIAFCCAFTVTVLLASFTSSRNTGEYYPNFNSSGYGVDELVIGTQKYVVVTTSKGGIAICKQ